MAKFLKPKKLITEIERLFEDAQNLLVIVSPFIKLDSGLKEILSEKINDSNFEVVLLYGKNESDRTKSLGSDDLDFFKKFANVEIFYHPHLHAKYYANDYRSIVTSLNLHSYSIANNIEVGVLFERKSRLSVISDNQEDDKSFLFFEEIFEQSDCVFSKRIEQKRSFFGLIKGDKTSKIEVDKTGLIKHESSPKSYYQNDEKQKGYCIRTGESIPFDMSRPFSKKGFDSWAQYSNEDYPEKFCHFSGEKTFGETTFAKPVLYKYYKKAAEIQNKTYR